MKKILLGVGICSILALGSGMGCIALPTNEDGSSVMPPAISEVIKASEVVGGAQVNAVIEEGMKWVDTSITSATGGGVGLASLIYLGRLLLRSRKKSAIMFDSMDDGSKERAKELAKHTSMEKELA
jgi:hypothetical protein